MRFHIGDFIFDPWPEVVGNHVAHRPRTKNPLPIELPAVEQHLSKAHVVTDCRKCACSPAVKLRLAFEEFDVLWLSRQGVLRKWNARGARVAIPTNGKWHPAF